MRGWPAAPVERGWREIAGRRDLAHSVRYFVNASLGRRVAPLGWPAARPDSPYSVRGESHPARNAAACSCATKGSNVQIFERKSKI